MRDRSALGHALAQVDSDVLPSCGCRACRRRDPADTGPAPSDQAPTDRPAALLGPSALTRIPVRLYEISVPVGARLRDASLSGVVDVHEAESLGVSLGHSKLSSSHQQTYARTGIPSARQSATTAR